VHLSHAVGLKSMDRNGFSDPYVKLVLGKNKVTSKTIYKTLNPRWDEDFMFAGSLAQLRNEVLHVHGWDYDGAFSKSDKLGDGSVDLSQVAGLEEGGAIEVAVELDDGQETPGVVHLVVSLEKPAECGAASGMPASAASATGSSGLAAMV
jgi:Ca2+-dependent lipid-binding protein